MSPDVRTPRGQESWGVQQITGTEISPKRIGPRQAVQQAQLVDLVTAWLTGNWHPFAILDDADGNCRFICPKCGHSDHNGGTAYVIDNYRWGCDRCRRTLTRYMFERLVLEDADALTALYERDGIQ
jgi:hypothetical protein